MSCGRATNSVTKCCGTRWSGWSTPSRMTPGSRQLPRELRQPTPPRQSITTRTRVSRTQNQNRRGSNDRFGQDMTTPGRRGVPRAAGQDEIKRVPRKLLAENHPDRTPDNKPAEDRYKAVSEAKEVLT